MTIKKGYLIISPKEIKDFLDYFKQLSS